MRKIFKKIAEKFSVTTIIMGCAVLILLLVVAFPMLMVFVESFIKDGEFTVEFFQRVFTEKANLKPIINTLTISILTAFFGTIIGSFFAWLVARTDIPFKSFFKTVFLIPYMIPPFIGAIAWGFLLSPRTGFFNRWFMELFNTEHPLFNLYSYWGIVFVMSVYFYPYVFISASGALERMDPTLEEAARSSGAGIFRVMWEITLPLILPAIASGTMLIFIASAANFGIPAMIGMEAGVYVLTTRIYAYLYSEGFSGIQMATTLSLLLVITATIALFIKNYLTRKKSYAIIAGKSMTPMTVKLDKFRIPLFLICALFILITLVAPFVMIVLISFVKAYGQPIKLENMTLTNYASILLRDSDIKRAIGNSFLLAVASSTILVFIGSIISYIIVKTKVKGKWILNFLSTLPYSIPGTVVAIAMILVFSGKFQINLYGTVWILLIAYVARYMSFGVKNISASLEQVDASLEEVARISGASWFRSFFDVVIPLIRPGIIAAWFLAFMPILRELTMSVLLYGPNTKTIGVTVFELQEGGYYTKSAAMATLILVIIVSGNLILNLLAKKLGNRSVSHVNE